MDFMQINGYLLYPWHSATEVLNQIQNKRQQQNLLTHQMCAKHEQLTQV